jgi:hypothetical protein
MEQQMSTPQRIRKGYWIIILYMIACTVIVSCGLLWSAFSWILVLLCQHGIVNCYG